MIDCNIENVEEKVRLVWKQIMDVGDDSGKSEITTTAYQNDYQTESKYTFYSKKVKKNYLTGAVKTDDSIVEILDDFLSELQPGNCRLIVEENSERILQISILRVKLFLQ